MKKSFIIIASVIIYFLLSLSDDLTKNTFKGLRQFRVVNLRKRG